MTLARLFACVIPAHRAAAHILRMSTATLLVGTLSGCADRAQERDADTGIVAELVPRRIASVCDNADAVGCLLGPLAGALPRADGSTIVAHHGGPLFRFDSAGVFIDSLGRTGRGPGEFESIMQFGGGVADSVGIVDVRGLRVAWIPPVGVGGRNEPIPYEMSTEDVQVSDRGSFLFAVPGTDTAGARVSAYVTWFRNDSTRRYANIPAISHRLPNSEFSRPPPLLVPRTHWCVAPAGRIAFASGDEWTVRLVDSTGSVRAIELDSLPLDKIELADMQRVAWGRTEAKKDSMARRQMDANPNRTHPTVLKMACDDAVIMLVTSANASRSLQRWRVIDWSGRELVRLQLPTDAKLSMVAHGRFTVLRSDDQTGLEWVEVYAVPSSGT